MTLFRPDDTHPAVPPPGFRGLDGDAAVRRHEAEDGEGAGGRTVREMLAPWLPILARLSVPPQVAAGMARRALAADTRFIHELLLSQAVTETALFRALAAELDLAFLDTVDPGAILVAQGRRLESLRTRQGLRLVLIEREDGTTVHLLADPLVDPAVLRRLLAGNPRLRGDLCVTAPSILRAAVMERSSARLLFDAQHGLLLRSPEFSARTVVSAWQGASAAAVVLVFALLAWLAPAATTLALEFAASSVFIACIGLRLLAWGAAAPPRPLRPLPVDTAQLPVYSVLVALHRESEVVPQLLAALGRLEWPRSRLEIKLVCEADDAETLDALRRYRLRPEMEVVLVPPALPRTKPKALAYALPLCSGDYVTLYDAEDRPDPLQLVEAWQHFQQASPQVACLQAPLVVTNNRASALSAMFAFEYAALFRAILPWLARRGLVVPLGGTSNHFRRAALEEVGGWDAFNVTEDAELGIRLARYGYRTEVIARPTFEEAPETVAVWLPQRIRWFKGWMQTWLVHMREPAALWREIGPASFLVMQIMSLGMVASALFHPFFLGSVLYGTGALFFGAWGGADLAILLVGLGNVLAGYCAFIVLGLATLTPHEKARPVTLALLTPFHWMMLSLAAWVALWEIYRRPHHWSKTPHGDAARRGRS